MSQEQKVAVTEDDIIEYVLNTLYTNLDKNEMHLEKDILIPTKLELNEKQTEQIRELVMATNFARSSVGFGKSGYVYLSGMGIQSLKTYGSYKNYLAATQGLNQEAIVEHKPAESKSANQKTKHIDKNFGDDDMAH